MLALYLHKFYLILSTHIPLYRTPTNRIGCQIESLGHSLLVSTATGRVVATGKCVRSVIVEIQQRKLVADLILLKMTKFDVIF